MIFSTDRRSRPRRFFGLRGVVRRLRRSDDGGAGDAGRTRRQPSLEADRALQSERARFTAKLDLELRVASRGEAAMRRELGCAAREFVRRRAYRRLGFVRLGDYARERLGVSARTVHAAAWLATRLDALPAVSRAYDRSELSWAQARAICTVAIAADEERWLDLARRSSVETLERVVARTRQADDALPAGVPTDPDGDTDEIDGEPAVRWRFACPARVRALWRRALELASRAAGEPLADWRAAEVVAAEGSSGRPQGASLGDRALIAAIRLAHRARRRKPGGAARHLLHVECGAGATNDVAASCQASPGFDPATVEPPGDVSAAGERPACSDDVSAAIRTATSSDCPVAAWDREPGPTPIEPIARATLILEPPAPSDPFALDARLAEAIRVLRTIEPRIGRLLRVVVDQRIYRTFGHPTFEDYVRERLGLSARKAWALLKIEKALLRSADFARAYRDGRLSWVRALALLPVLDRTNAAAWIARAESVTVRRLNDEVEWVLASRDALGPDASSSPPPVDSRLVWPVRVTAADECRDSSSHARLQIGAHAAEPVVAPASDGIAPAGAPSDATNRHSASERREVFDVCDAEIRFTGPVSVVTLLRDVLDAFADPHEPRWTALERLLRHVITHWESTPRHHDPVFARDRWRCTVPACSARRNLHDHHIRFRSRGGDNTRDNRTTVCAAHHLHGIHDGTIHATGTAPYAIEWRLGVRPGAPPFLTCVGDRYCMPDDDALAREIDGLG